MEKVLVTGGLGFVGSTLVKALLKKENYDITVIDNLSSPSSNISYKEEGVKYMIEDILNIDNISYKDLEFDIIYHLAGLARIQPSFINPVKYFNINTFGKYNGEEICKLFSKLYNISAVTARFFNVYGLRQPTEGKFATVLGIFERQCKNNESLTIIGDGEQRRDFTHVNDIVNGLVELSKGEYKGEIYNLGTGRNYSINQLVEFFECNSINLPERPGEARLSIADISKTVQDLDWEPTYSLRKYIKDFKNIK